MYLPKIYENFTGKFPEVFKDFKQLGQTCREAGPLDQKCQDLIKLGIAMGANSRGSVMSSTRKAIEAGASEEEIHLSSPLRSHPYRFGPVPADSIRSYCYSVAQSPW